jgi:hypothetical protein
MIVLLFIDLSLARNDGFKGRARQQKACVMQDAVGLCGTIPNFNTQPKTP